LELIYLGFEHLQSLSPTTIVTDADPAIIAALATVYPNTHHLLCIWHVQKDMIAYIKKELHTQAIQRDLPRAERAEFVKSFTAKLETDWTKVLYASTEEDFETYWTIFQTRYSERYPIIVNYLTNQWISHKEKIIKAWTNKILHYGTTVTSRAEGFQSDLKPSAKLNKKS